MADSWRYDRYLSLTYEFAVFSFYLFTFIADINLQRTYAQSSFVGKWEYLTYWNFLFQTIYFFISFWKTLFKYEKPNLYWSVFLAGIVFPLCMFVNIVFWILYFIDREMILPEVLDAVYPLWMNHVQHTAIVPILLIERFLTKSQYPDSRNGLKGTLFFGVIYLFWVTILAHYKGSWVYPFLDILSWPGRIGFFMMSGFLLVGFYFLGAYVNKLFWGNEYVGSYKTKAGKRLKKYD